MSILTAIITASDVYEAQHKIAEALKFSIGAIELRIDCFLEISLEKIKELKALCPLPVIFSLWTKAEGGCYHGSERERLDLIMQLLELEPEYFDLESNIASDFVTKIHKLYPKTKLICSYYNFEKTPDNLKLLFYSIKKDDFDIYKLVVQTHSFLDVLRIVHFVSLDENKKKIVGICLGKFGQSMSILMKVLGSKMIYANLHNDNIDLGELTLETLCDVYNYAYIDQHTKIFALLSGNISTSIGHIFHNKKFRENCRNAVYIKIQLQPPELVDFFSLIKGLPFFGFSVTMPLKEKILPFLHDISEEAKQIGAINTILIEEQKFYGFNTDSKGALDAIEAKIAVSGKKIVIIGAGGVAKAIAFEAIKRNATVTIINIIEEEAKKVARKLNCDGFGLSHITKLYQDGYDILINATSVGMQGIRQKLPIAEEKILPDCAVMDVVNKQDTPFINAAKKRNRERVYVSGYEMYVNQAIAQQEIWFK